MSENIHSNQEVLLHAENAVSVLLPVSQAVIGMLQYFI